MCHRAEYGPRFFVFRAEKASEVLRVDPKKLNSYVGVVNQPPPKWSRIPQRKEDSQCMKMTAAYSLPEMPTD